MAFLLWGVFPKLEKGQSDGYRQIINNNIVSAFDETGLEVVIMGGESDFR